MWRYGAMALVALTFSNENILFLGKISTHTPRHIKKTSQSKLCSLLMFCDSDRIQTCNLLIRSQMLYSVELRSLHFRIASAKVTTFFETTKTFSCFFEKSYF